MPKIHSTSAASIWVGGIWKNLAAYVFAQKLKPCGNVAICMNSSDSLQNERTQWPTVLKSHLFVRGLKNMFFCFVFIFVVVFMIVTKTL